jgi:hypothetical protein
MNLPTDSGAGVDLPPLVLFEAEVTAGGAYDNWQDMTGEQYHFPNQYRNRVVHDRRFVYYRGVRRAGGARGRAEYFGHGRIGEVWFDESSLSQPRKAKWAWFCSIDDYVEFPSPVAANQQGKYFETITHARAWQVGVRLISEETYAAIITAAGVTQSPLAPEAAPPSRDTLEEMTDLLRVRPATVSATGVIVSHAFRRSRRAAAIGRRAEQLVLARLWSRFSDVRWLSAEGELPGYDLDYEDAGLRHAVEVKGTTGSYFPAIELTINEWRAAERLRDRFWLYLVASCDGAAPCVQIIRDPVSLLSANKARVSPLLLRFELQHDGVYAPPSTTLCSPTG